MKQKWKEEQFIEISASELFVWWDWLDSLEDTPEKAFDLFTMFLEECEDQLEFNDKFVSDFKNIEEKDSTKITDIENLFSN